MCIGLPMRIVELSGLNALCEGGGRREEVTLALVGPAPLGAHVLVHLGTAIRRLDAAEAQDIADALDAVQKAAAGEPFEHLIQDLVDREPELPAHLKPADAPQQRQKNAEEETQNG